MKINFPKPTNQGNDSEMNPLNQLEAFCVNFNKIYSGHFFGVITTSSELIDNSTSIISYAFWIEFLKIKDYSYRLFELNPTKLDGGYPLTATAFHGPPEDYGEINTPKELEKVINDILNSQRGRFIILSNY
jgi:hypothetical protein